MHIITERDILKEIDIIAKDAKKHGHKVTTILAKDFELEELHIAAKRRFSRLRATSQCSFIYKGIKIKRDDRPAEPHQD